MRAIPITPVDDDIVAEIYGYKITRFMIISEFTSQTLFALICQLAVLAPCHTFRFQTLSNQSSKGGDKIL